MKIPSKTECYQLIHKMKMLDNIVAHSFQVCRVALLLVDNLKTKWTSLNRDLVQASALLHDITKTRSFKTKENHAQTGAQLLRGRGYPEVGQIIGQHVVLDEYFASENLTEIEIVNYADKRVLHDKVVPLKERRNYILQKYGTKPEYRHRILMLWKNTEKLEERLFFSLPFSPGKINHLIKSEDCFADFSAFKMQQPIT